MEKAASMTIELTVISAEDLVVSRNKRVKGNAFVVVRSDPFNSRSTGMDKEGGAYPAWNERMVMELPAAARFITVEAHSGSTVIGAATIPVSDFAGGLLPVNYLNFLSYRLKSADGTKNGIVNLSVKVKRAAARGGAASCSGEPWARVPVADGVAADCRGMVTGIPVSYINLN